MNPISVPKHPMKANRVIYPLLAAVLAMAIWAPAQIYSAEPGDGKPAAGEKMKGCEEMKEAKKKLMDEMKGQDAELAELVGKMNGAAADKKLEALADIVTRMVKQQAEVHIKTEEMEAKMMKHMMEHMGMGKESMAECPMMKGMKDMKDGDGKAGDAGDAHKNHH